jgi:rhamnulose-1-phosphate aldolase
MNEKIEGILNQIQEISEYLWLRGWAERNGGNISVNMTKECESVAININRCVYVDYQQLDMKLANKIFFCSGTGLRIRDLAKSIDLLQKNSCILKVDENAKGYHIIWGGESQDFRPTSEFISHLNIHLDLIERKSDCKAIIHTHPTELISLTHSKEYSRNSEQISHDLWRMLPEVRAFVPRGVGLVPYALPSSEKLADLTVECLRKYDVALWEKHGALSVGSDVVEAFDFIDVANKGAKIFLQCLSSGFVPEGMTDTQMRELEEAFEL